MKQLSKNIIQVIAALVLITNSHAADFNVTSVIREVPLKQTDIMYKDFYINAGTNNGLKQGAFIDAKRRMVIFDNANSKMMGDTSIRIARLKVIHVDKNVSIARLVEFYPKDQTPIAGYDSVMIGDVIEVSDKQ